MTDKKQGSLLDEFSPEELAELEASNTGLLKAIQENNAIASAWLASWRCRKEMPETAQAQAA